MDVLIDWFWLHTWWSYAGADDPLHAIIYRSINLIEGLFWMGFALFVLRRRAKQPRRKRSTLEFWYALAFFLFALSDFREAVALQSWLIWVKGVNLVVLLYLRHRITRTLYPGKKF